MLGAAKVIVGDLIPERLQQAKRMGCEIIDLNKNPNVSEEIDKILGEQYVDCAIDCVGFESNGHHGRSRVNQSERAEVLNAIFEAVKPGGGLSIPGLYLPMDTGASKLVLKVLCSCLQFR